MYKTTFIAFLLSMHCVSLQSMKRGFTEEQNTYPIEKTRYADSNWNNEWYLYTYEDIKKIDPFIKEIAKLPFYSKLLQVEVEKLSIKYEQILNAHEENLSYFCDPNAPYTHTIQDNLITINKFKELIPVLKDAMSKEYNEALIRTLKTVDYQSLCDLVKSSFFNPMTTSIKYNNIPYPLADYMLISASEQSFFHKEKIVQCFSLLLFVTNNNNINNINDFFKKYDYMERIGITVHDVQDQLKMLQTE